MVKVSIIFAVQDGKKKSVENALASYKNQSLKNIEIIIIDCATTDGTTQVLKSFLSDKRISYHRIDETGKSGARNLGIQLAQGEYVTFGSETVIFTPELVKDMYDSAKSEDADLCVAPMASYDIYGKHEFKTTGILKKRRLISRFDTNLIWNPAVTNKMFRRKKILEMGLEFSAYGKAREAAFSLPFAFEAERIVCSTHGAACYMNPVNRDEVSEYPLEHYISAYRYIVLKANDAFSDAVAQAKTDFDRKELVKEQTCYIDEILLKEITVMLYLYYRHFWKLGDEEIKNYTSVIESLVERLSHRGLKTFQRMNKDILVDGRLISDKTEMAQKPKATVCIGKSENRGHLHEKRLFIQVSSIFNQTMPNFELFVDERLRDIFPKEYVNYPNVRFINAGSLQEFKEFALDECRTDFIMFQDGYARLNPKVLMRHYNTLSGRERYGFSTSPITCFDGKSTAEYSFSELVFSDMEQTRVTDENSIFALDLFFCNKLFRTEHLRGIRFSFTDNPVLDMYSLYRHSKFIKISHRGAYLSYTEEEALAFLKEQEKMLPSDCKNLYKNYKKVYRRSILRKRRKQRVINFAKKIKQIIIRVLFKLINIFLYGMKIKDRAFFYTIRADGRLLENADLVYNAVDAKKVVFAKMLPHSLKDQLKVRYYMLTSKVIVTDDYLKYLRSIRLREGQKVVQLWHASGAFKRFGLDAPSRLSRRDEYRTHSQYTDVCVSSEYVRQFYAHAFGVDMDVVKAIGSPRTDNLLDEGFRNQNRLELETKHPLLKNKKIYLYLPTFREQDGTLADFDPQIDWARLNDDLSDDEIFIVSRHPVMKKPFFKDAFYSRVKDYSFESTSALLSVADVVVTDYSSVIFDASLMDIPLCFYCPDYGAYERSFYLDFEKDLPGELCKSFDELLETIRISANQSRDNEKASVFKDKEVGACDGNSTKRAAELIMNYLK